ncbi:MAG: lactate utilization protein C [Gracilibacter sp. BRH_c7a]|nr:MAG: lactate utilization protein C [Gracilibacter sp. BRH_c7a]
MIDLKQWHNATIGQRVIKALKKNNFEAQYFDTKEEALDYLLNTIPDRVRLGIGGSFTLREIGLIDILKEKGFTLYDHNDPDLTPEAKIEQRYKQLSSDIFLASSNAVTLKGELVNIDGIGNRVASMSFGPGKVIIVVGINKVVRDIEEGLQRIRLQAAPLNSKRHESPNPCIKSGQCQDCQSTARICNITSIIHKCPPLSSIEVVVIGQSLGF